MFVPNGSEDRSLLYTTTTVIITRKICKFFIFHLSGKPGKGKKNKIIIEILAGFTTIYTYLPYRPIGRYITSVPMYIYTYMCEILYPYIIDVMVTGRQTLIREKLLLLLSLLLLIVYTSKYGVIRRPAVRRRW